MRGKYVPRTIAGFCTSCASIKLIQRTSNRGLWFVLRSTRTLWWISLLLLLKAVCEYASHSALGTVLDIANLPHGKPQFTFLLGQHDAWTALPTIGLLIWHQMVVLCCCSPADLFCARPYEENCPSYFLFHRPESLERLHAKSIFLARFLISSNQHSQGSFCSSCEQKDCLLTHSRVI